MKDIQAKPSSAAVVVALRCGSELLLVGIEGDDACGFAGGNLMPHERPGIGARRKVREETGINIDGRGTLQPLGALLKDEGAHKLYFFGVSLPSGCFDGVGKTGPKGHRLLRCQLAELDSLHLRNSHRRLVERIASKKKKASS